MKFRKFSAALLAMSMTAGMAVVPAMAEESKDIEPCTIEF